jgi:antitoxin component of RelBE/YafQ-DinJ toxin-antitoxin module
MPQLAVRLPKTTQARLDAVCAERGLTRSQLVRQLIVAAVEGAPVEPLDTPGEEELLELLSERARAGNVAAIRSLFGSHRRDRPP